MSEQTAGVKFPPPLLYLGAAVISLVLDTFVYRTPMGLEPPWSLALGGAALLAGGVLILWAAGLFRKAGTAVKPWEPATAFVTAGPYKFTRNPMYLGMSLSLAGVGLAMDSWLVLAFLLPVLLIMQFMVIRKEEHYLATKFGDAYRAYKKRVRRWI
jgi:protein-S-isoprenylcysteine O-methyltransferase Ste14